MKIHFLLCLFLPFVRGLMTSKKVEIPSKIPDIYKRDLMNKILLSSIGTSCGPLLFGFLNVFSPPISNSNTNGIIAKDSIGNDVYENTWIKEHPYPIRNLVLGLKGDAHYLITTKDNQLESFALNAVCTHLGCVVPWNPSENKFMCPCHGSQYNEQGKVVRGPAPRSLALAHVEKNDGKVILTPWKETDFRDGEEPWWN